MKKYLISLEKDQHRRELFFAQKNTQDFIYFSAINTMDETEDELNKRFNFSQFLQKYHRIVTKGEIGCTLSHLSIYQQIINSNFDDNSYVLICEDDALLCEDFDKHLKQIEKQESIADIILLGQSKVADFNHLDLELLYPTTFGILQKRINESNFKLSYPYKEYYAGTVTYLIKKSAAKKIIQYMNQSNKPYWLADDFILFSQILKLKIKIVRPLMAIENPKLSSNLSPARGEIYHHRTMIMLKYPLKKILAIIRNLLNRN